MPAKRPIIRASVPHEDVIELGREGWTIGAIAHKAVKDKLAQRPAQPYGHGPILWTPTNPGTPDCHITFYQRAEA